MPVRLFLWIPRGQKRAFCAGIGEFSLDIPPGLCYTTYIY